MTEGILWHVFCIIIDAILMLSITLQKTKNDRTASRFLLLAHSIVAFSVFNLLSELAEGNPAWRGASYVVNLFAFICVDAVIITFSVYFTTLVGTVKKKWEKVMNPAVVFTYLRILVVFVLFLTGNLFTVDENGHYQEGSLAFIPYIMSSVILLMLVLVVFRNRKCFGTKQFLGILCYLVLPVPCMIVEMFTGYYVLSGISLTISLLLIYVVVQASILESARVRETVLEELSSTDLLTSLNNRRAYYNRLATLGDEQSIGVLFCDINGLKYMNDHLGHAEGDKLILRFAELLNDSFPKEDVFRISGDEFVVVMPDVTSEGFDRTVEAFRTKVLHNASIAALGSSYGVGRSAEHLVSVAEGIMYDDKREYYLRTGTKR